MRSGDDTTDRWQPPTLSQVIAVKQSIPKPTFRTPPSVTAKE